MPDIPRNPRKRPVFKIAVTDDQEKFKPLPAPVGPYPYHLDIAGIIPGVPQNKLVFQLCGDTGGIILPTFQHQVVKEMNRQFDPAIPVQERPQFFFHLGDVVYNFGQAEGYEEQFFEPFKNYPAPIFAIAGNHDADIDPLNPKKPKSLEAFMQVFCSDGRRVPFAGNSGFKSNVQPNVYWTLTTPLADIIGLYCNVPRFGTITPDQKDWFISELKRAAATKGEKALIICMHDAPYTADINHGSSLYMQLFLSAAFEEAGVYPDIVFSGHVHNYQRFTKQYPNGKSVPFVVAGAGGYAQLHAIALPGDPGFPDESEHLDNAILENYCDSAHGFLKVTVERSGGGLMLSGEYYTINDEDIFSHASLFDEFNIQLGYR